MASPELEQRQLWATSELVAQRNSYMECIRMGFNKESWTRMERIMSLRNNGRFEEALNESYTLLPETSDGDDRASVLENMITCCLMLGRLDESRSLLRELRQLNVVDLEVQLNAEFCEACVLLAEGKLGDGVRKFAAMLHEHDELQAAPQFRYLYEDLQYRRALALVSLGEFEKAIPLLKEATSSFDLDRAIDAQQAHFALGVCFDETGGAEAARSEFLRVVNFGLSNDLEQRARYRLAKICFNSGAFAQAKHQLEMILQTDPRDHSAVPRTYVYEQLSHVYRHLGDRNNAERYLELARRE